MTDKPKRTLTVRDQETGEVVGREINVTQKMEKDVTRLFTDLTRKVQRGQYVHDTKFDGE